MTVCIESESNIQKCASGFPEPRFPSEVRYFFDMSSGMSGKGRKVEAHWKTKTHHCSPDPQGDASTGVLCADFSTPGRPKFTFCCVPLMKCMPRMATASAFCLFWIFFLFFLGNGEKQDFSVLSVLPESCSQKCKTGWISSPWQLVLDFSLGTLPVLSQFLKLRLSSCKVTLLIPSELMCGFIIHVL